MFASLWQTMAQPQNHNHHIIVIIIIFTACYHHCFSTWLFKHQTSIRQVFWCFHSSRLKFWVICSSSSLLIAFPRSRTISRIPFIGILDGGSPMSFRFWWHNVTARNQNTTINAWNILPRTTWIGFCMCMCGFFQPDGASWWVDFSKKAGL